jgi:hypothetical protein
VPVPGIETKVLRYHSVLLFSNRVILFSNGRNFSDATLGERRDLKLPVPDGSQHPGRPELQRSDAVPGLPVGFVGLQERRTRSDQSQNVSGPDEADGGTNRIKVRRENERYSVRGGGRGRDRDREIFKLNNLGRFNIT